MDKRLFFLLNMAQKRVFSHVNSESEALLDVSVTQLGALMLIGAMPGATQKDVSKVLGLSKASASGLIDRVVVKGLVEKSMSETDNRAVSLYLTDRGKTKAANAKPHLANLNSALTDGFSDAEIDTVLRFLNTMINRF
ncbi:Uncharacterised protein [BD1-7 clade bacterium]|uniref:HTH marR-type domain-containing protein n=1 Tax=BD1-7 clade bacterium TaxID=2029982 RepID=A0A5S9QV28_9GAMM|nr:Uncharacterised protein [BD1-7 clade bacterium]CAA0122894.1 Uncharacterised protein [BD1-7 clade bacterium]